ncbi:MAG: hypothetical protein JRG84_18470, partial [Deltaproteobacteria bacterium]|nr:hypothetical protein [Deltaproteobacteria bacterium]
TPFVTAPVVFSLEFPEGPPIPPCVAVDAIADEFIVINDGSTTSLSVLSNDECDDDGPISIVALPGDLSPDRGGVATSDGIEVLYTPDPGFSGFEEFDYTVEDAGLSGGWGPASVDLDTARVVVEVLEDLQPDATDDLATTIPSMPKFIDVTANDFLGNAPAVIEIVSPPTYGVASLQGADTIGYFPTPGFLGEDSFEYQVIDANGDTDIATVRALVFFAGGSVAVDLLTRDAENRLDLNVGRFRRFSLAILSEGEFFDAPALIDPMSLKLGPRQAVIFGEARVRDVDGDGDADLRVKFLTHQTGIECGDTSVMLTGQTFAGEPIFGSDFVIPSECP